MTKQQAFKQFTELYYEDKYNLQRAVDQDYCKVQLEWSGFVDNLNRDGEITDKQRQTWGTPFSKKGRK